MQSTLFDPNKVVIYGTITEEGGESFQARMEFDTNNVLITHECSDHGSYSVKMEFSGLNERLIVPEIAEAVPSEKWEISW